MTKDQAREILKRTKKDKYVRNAFVRGLQILEKYDDNMVPQFDLDVAFLTDFDRTVKMSEEDVVELAKLGFFEQEDAWAFQ